MESNEMNENSKKIYIYRKYMFILAVIIPFVAVFSFFFVIFSVIYIHNIVVTILFSIVTIEMIFMHFFYKRFTSMKLLVDETGIHFRNVQKHVDIAYQDIQKVSSKRLSSLGGWITVISNTEEKITLTVAMKDMGDFIRRLHEYLVLNEREDLADNPLLLKAYRTATFLDSDFRRASYLGIVTPIYAILSMVIAETLPDYGFNNTKQAVYTSWIVFLVGFTIIEYLYYKPKLMEEMKESGFKSVPFDEKSEKRTIRLLLITAVLIHLILTGILLFA